MVLGPAVWRRRSEIQTGPDRRSANGTSRAAHWRGRYAGPPTTRTSAHVVLYTQCGSVFPKRALRIEAQKPIDAVSEQRAAKRFSPKVVVKRFMTKSPGRRPVAAKAAGLSPKTQFDINCYGLADQTSQLIRAVKQSTYATNSEIRTPLVTLKNLDRWAATWVTDSFWPDEANIDVSQYRTLESLIMAGIARIEEQSEWSLIVHSDYGFSVIVRELMPALGLGSFFARRQLPTPGGPMCRQRRGAMAFRLGHTYDVASDTYQGAGPSWSFMTSSSNLMKFPTAPSRTESRNSSNRRVTVRDKRTTAFSFSETSVSSS
jgi:hypothetical protein